MMVNFSHLHFCLTITIVFQVSNAGDLNALIYLKNKIMENSKNGNGEAEVNPLLQGEV